jgi:hypothetical protein
MIIETEYVFNKDGFVENGPLLIDFQNNLIWLPNGRLLDSPWYLIQVAATLRPDDFLTASQLLERINMQRIETVDHPEVVIKSESTIISYVAELRSLFEAHGCNVIENRWRLGWRLTNDS